MWSELDVQETTGSFSEMVHVILFAAVPPYVRKGSAFPGHPKLICGYAAAIGM
jgi:hypothetical protein